MGQEPQLLQKQNIKLKKFFTYSVLFIISFSYLGGLFMTFWYMFDLNNFTPFIQTLLPLLLNITFILFALYIAKKYSYIPNNNKLNNIYVVAKVLLIFTAVSLTILLPLTSLTYSLVNDLILQNIQSIDNVNSLNTYLLTDMLSNFLAGIVGLVFSYIFVKLENPK